MNKCYKVDFDDGSTGYMYADQIAIKANISVEEVLRLYANTPFLSSNIQLPPLPLPIHPLPSQTSRLSHLIPQYIPVVQPVAPIYVEIPVTETIMVNRKVDYVSEEWVDVPEFVGFWSRKIVYVKRLVPYRREITVRTPMVIHSTQYVRVN